MIKPTLQDVEALPLDQLMMAWTNYIWMVGMQPMYHEMAVEGLSFPETVVLQNLQRGPLNVAEVADCIAITQSAASRAVDRLVRDGFVARNENQDDRRQKQLTLTATGEKLLQRFQSVMAHAIEPFTSALTVEESEQFRELIVKMVLTRIEADPPPRLDTVAATLLAKGM